MQLVYTVGKISIERVNLFPSKYFSNDAIHMIFFYQTLGYTQGIRTCKEITKVMSINIFMWYKVK